MLFFIDRYQIPSQQSGEEARYFSDREESPFIICTAIETTLDISQISNAKYVIIIVGIERYDQG